MRIVAILQARMGSTRLPGKMLLPLANRPLVQHVIERVRRATRLDAVVLAYPLADHAAFLPVLQSQADTRGVSFGSYAHQGDDADLVARFLGAAAAYRADLIVRVPCDNPCIEAEYIDAAVEQYLVRPTVFFSNTTDRVGDTLVDGVGAEVFSYNRLQWLDRLTRTTYAHLPQLREHPHRCFAFLLPEAHLRLDVNTPADYDVLADLYAQFGHNRFHVREVLDVLKVRPMTRARVEA